AVTKADTGEPELVVEEVSELLPGVETVQVSALERTGLHELLAALDRAAGGPPGRASDDGPARLHLDRSFTLRGIGTVVTGTLWSGAIGQGDNVRILPRGLSARVRSVQVHDQPVERAAAGQRVALNLVGVGWRDLGRGDVVTSPDADLAPTYLLDAALSLEPGARPPAPPRGGRPGGACGTQPPLPSGVARAARGASGRALRARRQRHDRHRPRRARHLAQVRASAARAPGQHEGHAPDRRRAQAARPLALVEHHRRTRIEALRDQEARLENHRLARAEPDQRVRTREALLDEVHPGGEER